MPAGFSAPVRYVPRYTPPVYRSAPKVQASTARFGFAPLRQVMRLPGAMQLNRYNMGGPAPRGPRNLAPNMQKSFENTYYSMYGAGTTGSGRFGPRVPTPNLGALDSFRNWHSTAQNAVIRDMKAYQAYQASLPPIIKYRNPRTGEITDTPYSKLGLNKFGQNQNWRYQQNNARQGSNSSYSSGMSQFAINSPSGVGINKMR